MSGARTRAVVEKAVARYARDHWGQRGRHPGVRQLLAADPTRPLVELGQLVQITYRTRKGSEAEDVDYEHDFQRPYPVLAYEPGSSLLVILGGKYRVETRGIVG